jgi:toxin-antitoxin system PIN domain toxin
MISLLDVNVLIALCDPAHPHAAAAGQFFAAGLEREGWATCPLVENGFLRIFGSPKYPGGPGSPGVARQILQSLVARPGHQFWPDDVSLLNIRTFSGLADSHALTDLYLLGLAVKRGGCLVTFDQEIEGGLVLGGSEALRLL